MILDYSNIFYILMPIITFLGFIATITQLFFLIQTNKREYLWRKKIAAQEAVWNYHSISPTVGKLNNLFNITNIHEPISLTLINKEIDHDSTVKIDIQKLLNYYDALARGVNEGIYDENIIKLARGQTLVRQFTNYLNFIIYRRNLNSKNYCDKKIPSYSQFEKLAIKWDLELNQSSKSSLKDLVHNSINKNIDNI